MTFPFPDETPVVTFSYANWVASFPEMAGCSPAQGQAFFDRADSFFANSICNPAVVLGATRFARMLYLLTSHLAFLNAPRGADGLPAQSGIPAPSVVGRINSASEGSVSIGAEWSGSGSPSEAWFLQTRYGAEYWQATSQFRTMRYAAQPTVVAGTRFPYIPVPGWQRFRR